MSTRIIQLVAFLMCVWIGQSSASAQDADAWQRVAACRKAGDYRGAVSILKPLADKGGAKAEYKLAEIYFSGGGKAPSAVPINEKEGLRLLVDSAGKNYAEAQYQLGIRYEDGSGVQESSTQAVKWLKKAAINKDPNAAYALSGMYFNDVGYGKTSQASEAVKWGRMAAELGSLQAQKQMGGVFFTGRDVPKDYKEAAKWYKMSAARNDPSSLYHLAYLYEHGLGVPKDAVLAFNLCKKAAESGGTPDADKHLAWMYRVGFGTPKKEAEAQKWERKSTTETQGDVDFCAPQHF